MCTAPHRAGGFGRLQSVPLWTSACSKRLGLVESGNFLFAVNLAAGCLGKSIASENFGDDFNIRIECMFNFTTHFNLSLSLTARRLWCIYIRL